MDRTSTSTFAGEPALNTSVNAFSIWARWRRVTPSSPTYSAASVHKAATALGSPFSNAAANASPALRIDSRSASRSVSAGADLLAAGPSEAGGEALGWPHAALHPATAAVHTAATTSPRRVGFFMVGNLMGLLDWLILS